MTQQEKVAENLRRFAMGVAAHDRENPTHKPAYGIGMTYFDINCLGFDEGEEVLPGITIHADSGGTGNFRVLCGEGTHGQPQEVAEKVTRAVGVEA